MNDFVDECLEFAAAVNFFKTKAVNPKRLSSKRLVLIILWEKL
jgi:hypothetical protein